MKATLRSPYAWLLAGLLGTALVVPCVEGVRAGAVVLHLLSAAVLAAAVGAVAGRGRHVLVALALALPTVALSAVELSVRGPRLATARYALLTAFFAYTALVVLADVLRRGRVTGEKICGAVCVLLLIGGTWASAYLTLLQLSPGAIRFPSSEAAGVAGPYHWLIGDVLYFSFITLTTLGYGDIVPVSPVARAMAWLEATMGQLYLAILVARLVGAHIAQGEA
ncbi:MAG TPA: potassium channel family protein [Candidatus Polarisedimenticolaceae bacterium]|nr:potassium channel family protein [Candidatus Polarisedimenticolaceae bacterium]